MRDLYGNVEDYGTMGVQVGDGKVTWLKTKRHTYMAPPPPHSGHKQNITSLFLEFLFKKKK